MSDYNLETDIRKCRKILEENIALKQEITELKARIISLEERIEEYEEEECNDEPEFDWRDLD